MAFTRVGQSGLASQVAAACAGGSDAILDPDVAATLGAAAYRARRIDDALTLIGQLQARPDGKGRVAAFLLQAAVLARGFRLTAAEQARSQALARDELNRSKRGGDRRAAAAAAYNLGKLLGSQEEWVASVDALEEAAALDPTYRDRAYYLSDLAGAQFESGQYDDAAQTYEAASGLDADPLVQALAADALMMSGAYRDAEVTLTAYLEAHRRPRDAEWRLKLVALPCLREVGGDRQRRRPDVAGALVAQVDLTGASGDMPIELAGALLHDALAADACDAEAWFRLAILALSTEEHTEAALSLAVTAAVLHRYSAGAWQNAVTLALHADDDETLRDCVLTGVRFLGADLAATLAEVDAADQPPGFLDLLDESLRLVEADRAEGAFTMRIPDDSGAMIEFAFGPDTPEDPLGDQPSSDGVE